MIKKTLIISLLSLTMYANDIVKELTTIIKPIEKKILTFKEKYKEDFQKNDVYTLKYCNMLYTEDQFIMDNNLAKQLNTLNNASCNYTYFFHDPKDRHFNALMLILKEDDKKELQNLIDNQFNAFKIFMNQPERIKDSELFFKKDKK